MNDYINNRIYKQGKRSLVTTRPFSLRNNLVNRAEEIHLKSFGSCSAYKYFFAFRGFKCKFEFTKDLIIDSISYKAHILLIKLCN